MVLEWFYGNQLIFVSQQCYTQMLAKPKRLFLHTMSHNCMIIKLRKELKLEFHFLTFFFLFDCKDIHWLHPKRSRQTGKEDCYITYLGNPTYRHVLNSKHTHKNATTLQMFISQSWQWKQSANEDICCSSADDFLCLRQHEVKKTFGSWNIKGHGVGIAWSIDLFRGMLLVLFG